MGLKAPQNWLFWSFMEISENWLQLIRLRDLEWSFLHKKAFYQLFGRDLPHTFHNYVATLFSILLVLKTFTSFTLLCNVGFAHIFGHFLYKITKDYKKYWVTPKTRNTPGRVIIFSFRENIIKCQWYTMSRKDTRYPGICLTCYYI